MRLLATPLVFAAAATGLIHCCWGLGGGAWTGLGEVAAALAAVPAGGGGQGVAKRRRLGSALAGGGALLGLVGKRRLRLALVEGTTPRQSTARQCCGRGTQAGLGEAMAELDP